MIRQKKDVIKSIVSYNDNIRIDKKTYKMIFKTIYFHVYQ